MTDKLYVGIDVSGNSLVVGLVDATGKKRAAACEYRNNRLGTEKLVADLVDEVNKTGAEQLHLCYRSDWIYDWHVVEYLSESAELAGCDAKITGSTQDRSKHSARFTHKPTRPTTMMPFSLLTF